MNPKIDNYKTLINGAKIAAKIKDELIERSLVDICNKAIQVAIEKHNFDNQTYNLEESYGYAIYHNGIMINQKIEGASDGSMKAASYLNSYNPIKDWECVIIAGADYAANLEGYIRRTDGNRSKAGDMLRVLSDSFNFVSLESIKSFK